MHHRPSNLPCNLSENSSIHTLTEEFHHVQTALRKWRGRAVRESSSRCWPCSVASVFCVCGWRESAGRLYSTCLTVSSACRTSILTLSKDTAPTDHQLCLFSPAALRDKCKCSSNLDALWEISSAALYLFITPCPASPPPPPPSHLPSRTSFIIPACSFFYPPLRSFGDVNKSDSGGRWNDRISLSAGSLVTLSSPLWLLLPPTPPLFSPLAAAATKHIILVLVLTS